MAAFEVVANGRLELERLDGAKAVVGSIGTVGRAKSKLVESVSGWPGALQGTAWSERSNAWGFVSGEVGFIDVMGIDGCGLDSEDVDEEVVEIWETRSNMFALLGCDVVLVNLWVWEVTRRDASCFELLDAARQLGDIGKLVVVLHGDDLRTPGARQRQLVRERLGDVDDDSIFLLPHSKYLPQEFAAAVSTVAERVAKLTSDVQVGTQPERLQLAWHLAESSTVPVASHSLGASVVADEAARSALRHFDAQLESVESGAENVGARLSDVAQSCIAEFVLLSTEGPGADPRVALREVAPVYDHCDDHISRRFSAHLRKVRDWTVAEFSAAHSRKLETGEGPSFTLLNRFATSRCIEQFERFADPAGQVCLERLAQAARRQLLLDLQRIEIAARGELAAQIQRRRAEEFRAAFGVVLGERHPVANASFTYWSEVTNTAREVWGRTESKLRADLDYESLGLQQSEIEVRVSDLARECHKLAVGECRSLCGDESVFASRMADMLKARLPEHWPPTASFARQVREQATRTGLLVALFSYVPLGTLQEPSSGPPPPLVEHFGSDARQRLVESLTKTAEAEGKRAFIDQVGHCFEAARTVASVVVGVCNTLAMVT